MDHHIRYAHSFGWVFLQETFQQIKTFRRVLVVFLKLSPVYFVGAYLIEYLRYSLSIEWQSSSEKVSIQRDPKGPHVQRFDQVRVTQKYLRCEKRWCAQLIIDSNFLPCKFKCHGEITNLNSI